MMVIRQKYNKFQNSSGYAEFLNSLPPDCEFVSSFLMHHVLTPVAYLRFPIITDGQPRCLNITSMVLNKLSALGYGKPYGLAGNHPLTLVANVVENFIRFDVKTNTHYLYICIVDVDPIQILDILNSIHLQYIYNQWESNV